MVGFEPTNNGFADHPLRPLGYISIYTIGVGFEPTHQFLGLSVFETDPFNQTWVSNHIYHIQLLYRSAYGSRTHNSRLRTLRLSRLPNAPYSWWSETRTHDVSLVTVLQTATLAARYIHQ